MKGVSDAMVKQAIADNNTRLLDRVYGDWSVELPSHFELTEEFMNQNRGQTELGDHIRIPATCV